MNASPIYHAPDSSIHVIARAVLMQGDKIVICVSEKGHGYLPGGHVENGESCTTALLREFKEEMGEFSHGEPEYIGTCENVFEFNPGVFQHEINMVFAVKINQDTMIESKESHISFKSYEVAEFDSVPMYPMQLKQAVSKWLIDREVFYKKI
jgi:ADP-ribose pyrophosphatase YjhB (NUDIX family)